MRIAHPSQPNRVIEGIAIIDNQSTSSWIDTKVDKCLGVASDFIGNSSFSLSTMDRLDLAQEGRCIRGLRIAPFRNGPSRPGDYRDIPECIERKLPSMENEMAYAEDVMKMKYPVSQYALNFPSNGQVWKTLALIGRDCLWAMPQFTMNNPNKSQGMIVLKTPLGFILVRQKTHRDGLENSYHQKVNAWSTNVKYRKKEQKTRSRIRRSERQVPPVHMDPNPPVVRFSAGKQTYSSAPFLDQRCSPCSPRSATQEQSFLHSY